MSKSNRRIGRVAFAALVAGSLTFGGAQALAGSSTAAASSGYVCVTRPQDPGCANYCLSQYPDMGGAHFCGGPVPGGWECVCAF
jgi:hypothetical protein